MNDVKDKAGDAFLGFDERMIRTSNAVLRLVAGEHLLVPIRAGQTLDAESLYILDEVGAWVWESLATPCTLQELVEGVVDAFVVSVGQDVEADLRELLMDMTTQGLIRTEAAT